mgnify:CR=1 FL=1
MTSFPRTRESSAGRVEHNPYTVFKRAFETNQTTSSITMSVPTLVAPNPTTAGVHLLEKGKSIIVKPYGTAADGASFQLAMQLWHPMYDNASTRTTEDVVWIPTTEVIWDSTLDSSTVAAGTVGPIVVGDMFCNIVLFAGGTSQSYMGQTPGNKSPDMIGGGDVPAKFTVTGQALTHGAKYVQFFVDIDGTTGTAATSGNALFAVI